MLSPDRSSAPGAATTDGSANSDATQTTDNDDQGDPAATARLEAEGGRVAAPQGGDPKATDLVGDHAAHFEGFDPAIHAVDKDGRPKPKKGGGWQLKRGGNMKTAAVDPAAAPRVAPAKPVDQVAKVSTTEAARQTCNLAVSLAVMIFGEHWAPQTDEEKKAVVGAVKNYFDAKGAVDVSPGTALVLVILAYSIPRVQHEATLTKLQKIKVGAYRFYLWARGFFPGRRA